MPIDPSRISWDSAPPQGGLHPLGPSDPKLPGQVEGLGLSNTKTADEIRRARAMEEFQRRKAAAEADSAELDVKTKRNQAPGQRYSAQIISQARQKVGNALTFRNQLQRAWGLFRETQQGGGVADKLGEYLPTPRNSKFDAAVDALQPLARQMFRVPGSGADSDKELQVMLQLLPKRSSFDEKNIQRFGQLDSMIRDIVHQNAPVAGMKVNFGKPKNGKPKTNVIDFNDLPE